MHMVQVVHGVACKGYPAVGSPHRCLEAGLFKHSQQGGCLLIGMCRTAQAAAAALWQVDPAGPKSTLVREILLTWDVGWHGWLHAGVCCCGVLLGGSAPSLECSCFGSACWYDLGSWCATQCDAAAAWHATGVLGVHKAKAFRLNSGHGRSSCRPQTAEQSAGLRHAMPVALTGAAA